MATRSAQAGPSRASTAAAPELARAPSRKKRPGRGRIMLVKVFYSLASARTASSTNSPNPHPAALAAPAQSQDISRESHKYTCFARLNAPVWVQLLGPTPTADLPATEYGRLTLKTCLSAICISRPELVDDPTKDYAVAALDPYESFLLSNEPTVVGQGITEGKGMLSWNLAEKREGTTWVCGRVAPSESSHDDSDDDEIPFDTLEVWLQLVERPAFTQDQFLTSLRSFANPTQLPPPDTADRLSSPPLRQSHSAPTHGDPIKKKRPRDTESLQRTFMVPKPPIVPAPTPALLSRSVASTSALPTPKLAASLQFQSPDVLALLNQFVPSWPTLGSELPSASSPLPNFDVDSEEGRKLIPALAILARASGIDMGPRLASPYDLPPPLAAASDSNGFTSLEKGKGREVHGFNSAAHQYPNLTADTTPPLPSPQPLAVDDINVDQLAESVTIEESVKAPPRRGKKGKPPPTVRRGYKKKAEAFAAISGGKESIELDEAGNKVKPSTSHPVGCLNCGRKKSSVWRENAQGHVACNACGIHFNKKGNHRAMADRATSPPAASIPTAPTLSRASSSRSLKGQLTLTCEADSLRALNSPKKRRIGGLIPPPSPSKRIGPVPRHSPAMDYSSIFRNDGATRTASGHIMTSPGRSPRRLAKSLGLGSTMWAATSPVRGSAYTFGGGFGDAAGAMSDPYDFSAIYAGNQSPSPERHARGNSASISTYLLTASPGTALRKVLNDTNIGIDIDINGFNSTDYDIDMKDSNPFSGGARGGMGMNGEPENLSFFLRSSPEERSEKENLPPTTGANDDGTRSTTAAASTDFDSLFRGDSTHLSSTALTQPSSPGHSLPSSPCVQPRTSSATPGQKGKGAATSGRAPPSIHHSFMDSLIPGLALEEESDSWTPATAGDDLESMADGINERYDISQLLLPSHSNRSITAPLLASRHHQQQSHPVNSDFDLPPSSPPALPSETFPTPSEFDSGITPEEDAYVDDDATTTYRHPSELPLPRADEELKATQNRIAILLHSLDLPPIANDAWIGGQLDSETLGKLLQLIQVRSAEKAREDATWSIEGAVGNGARVVKEERTTDGLYDNLFDSMET